VNQVEVEGAIRAQLSPLISAAGLDVYLEADKLPDEGGVQLWFRMEPEEIRTRSSLSVSTEHDSRCGLDIQVPKSRRALLDTVYKAVTDHCRGRSFGDIHFNGDQLLDPSAKEVRFARRTVVLFFYVLTTYGD